MPGGAAAFPLCRPTPAPGPSPSPPLQRSATSASAAAASRFRAHLRSQHCRVSCCSRRSGGDYRDSHKWAPHEAFLRAAAGAAISFSLLTSSLPLPPVAVAVAEATAAVQVPSPSAPARNCSGEEVLDAASEGRGPSVVTNEEIVEEAWEVVNESFLDAGNRGWSPEKWLQKKMDILRSTVPTRSRAHDIIKQMLASLGDPYTRFLTPAEFSKMARYDVTGIGINLREVPDDSGAIRLKVLGIILDGPAQLAGIRQGDEILSVNGMDIKGKSAFDVSSLLQGPKETLVTVEVRHGDCGPVHSITVERQSVARTPVFYRLEKMENGAASVGYVHLKEFNALAKKELAIAMKRLQDAGASWFVLDLRDNRGGLVQAGIEIAKLFLDEGQTDVESGRISSQESQFVLAQLRSCYDQLFPNRSRVLIHTFGLPGDYHEFDHAYKIVRVNCMLVNIKEVIYTVGRDPEVQRNVVAETAPAFTAPLIILVNSQTASASEIVVAALHDHCKAVLVGERTYGKGLIQSVFELHDGSGIVVTIGKYVTPNHMDINGNGIEPDFTRIPALSKVTQHISECQLSRKA